MIADVAALAVVIVLAALGILRARREVKEDRARGRRRRTVGLPARWE